MNDDPRLASTSEHKDTKRVARVYRKAVQSSRWAAKSGTLARFRFARLKAKASHAVIRAVQRHPAPSPGSGSLVTTEHLSHDSSSFLFPSLSRPVPPPFVPSLVAVEHLKLVHTRGSDVPHLVLANRSQTSLITKPSSFTISSIQHPKPLYSDFSAFVVQIALLQHTLQHNTQS